ncbi:hypothetical protein L210DRAFT_3191083 [Boletus edulis BED1]|uniref:F-box domain-containing protein n=1 Tax=Boletus edulis BED1 TaxID=1328754 RepID=A0AAD4GFI0_BOLED|nr:hypothetical protein L210DRAFT_3191083 [Boletus edulis BED1]
MLQTALPSVVLDYPTQTELQFGEQELRTRTTTVRFPSTPTESVWPIQLQLQPISFLPNEILIHIFQLGLDEFPHSAHARPLPVAVAGVCRSWRAVALRTPGLWTRVFVTSATPINHLQMYLERSRNLEIDVNFCHWSMPNHVDEDN